MWIDRLDKPKLTEKTLTTREALVADCGEIQARGYGIDDEEYHPGVRCLAAPVWTPDGQLAGAVGITAALATFPDARTPVVARRVIEAATALGQRLGSQPSMSPPVTSHPANRENLLPAPDLTN